MPSVLMPLDDVMCAATTMIRRTFRRRRRRHLRHIESDSSRKSPSVVAEQNENLIFFLPLNNMKQCAYVRVGLEDMSL